jgi:hypothetical protein
MWGDAEREDELVVVTQGRAFIVWFKEMITTPRKSILFGCILMAIGFFFLIIASLF